MSRALARTASLSALPALPASGPVIEIARCATDLGTALANWGAERQRTKQVRVWADAQVRQAESTSSAIRSILAEGGRRTDVLCDLIRVEIDPATRRAYIDALGALWASEERSIAGVADVRRDWAFPRLPAGR